MLNLNDILLHFYHMEFRRQPAREATTWSLQKQYWVDRIIKKLKHKFMFDS